ncbi:MAG: hypothetical protein PUB09_05195 [Firmicutes bacterium]|nr:hypothetical protein [Bacillota bacterium]
MKHRKTIIAGIDSKQIRLDFFSLKPGEPYNNLKKSYVVFICCFDFLKTGSAVSIFEKYSKKDDRYLGDECYTVIVNATSEELGINEGLKNLFSYMLTQEVPEGDEKLQIMDEAIKMHNTGEELAKMMTLEDKMVIEYEKGIEVGIEKGKSELIIEMHKNGMPIEQIATYTKLAIEEVSSIIKG